MININTLPNEVRTELRNDPCIVKAANGKEVNAARLSSIVLSSDVTHLVDVLPRHNYPSGEHPFYLQHTRLFYEAQNLFKELFSHEPDSLIYAYKGDFSSSIFLFTSKELITKIINKEEIKISWNHFPELSFLQNLLKKEKNKGIEVTNVSIENNTLSVTLPTGVFPVIGALNSIDSRWRTPNFNLIFATEYLENFDKTHTSFNDKQTIPEKPKNENDDWFSNIDKNLLDIFKTGISLYSIDKFNFKYNIDLCEYYNPFDMNIFYSKSISKAKTDFTKTIINFLLAVNRGGYLPINVDQFSSFIPHFYGYDRLAESVAIYEDREKRKLKHLYDTSFNFASAVNLLTCKSFIDYFLRDSIINFEMLRIDPAKEILKAFEKQPQIPLLTGARKEILSRFITKGLPNDRYDKFLNGSDGQVVGKTKVYQLL